MSVFARFSPRLQEAIVARLGWTSLRPVQEQAGEALLAGKNAVVLAPTAGGKTEASIFPTLSTLMDNPADGVGALYIAPIKALLNNQSERLGTYTDMVGLRRFVWHGDTPSADRQRFVREPAELLMTTPESLEVMLVSQRVDTDKLFRNLRIVIVDEIHALAGTDRGAHLLSVVERLARVSQHDLQRIGLSATVGNPADILTWLQGTSRRESMIVDPPKQPSKRQLLISHRPTLPEIARDAARVAKGIKSLFFCQTRSMTEAVAEHMRSAGTNVFVHHSAVSREERQTAEEKFNKGSDACIVCTSTLELGIDVGDLDRVLQAEAPDTVSSFLQRMGRTGRRAGQAANTSFFCETAEGVLQAIALIELARAGWVEDITPQDRCWPVLIHQLLAMSLASDGVTFEDAWEQLQRVPDFRGIRRAEAERLVAWMLRDKSLLLLDGRLLLGPKAERRYGRRNFMELYAVFSSPQTYTVETTNQQPLGTLNQGFVDRLVEGVSCFLLSGRPWAVLAIRHDDRRIIVEPAPRGRQPTWGGMLPQFLGERLCAKVRVILAADDVPQYLTPEAANALALQRAAMSAFTDPGRGTIEVAEGELRWWTFAGGRINHTLRYALGALHDQWKVIPDNFLIKIRGEGISQRDLLEAIEQIAEPEFWENERLWQDIADTLPAYRLSKFQPLMPAWVERESLASYLLDLEGAARWLTGRVPSRTPDLGVPLPASLHRSGSRRRLRLRPRPRHQAASAGSPPRPTFWPCATPSGARRSSASTSRRRCTRASCA
ncbi:DEAD/DEAH box helicase [Nannocystis pusilla]|uniref:DEAD/DEAH box helicase n=1 Tax=Nannocystis pusilla TaxID=889268 RepID=A0A9X3J363_9BACT|nr:DEAD/DEAH box helicase [Nannocystis pusilla]MCY1013406.1 DEAD/DEAH box helicase [Nannocystis pusilla]